VDRIIISQEQHDLTITMRRLLAAWRDVRELVEVGAYATGSDPIADVALRLKPAIDAFLCQPADEVVPIAESWAELTRLLKVGK
jgi:flagellum-specific ATP synthase